MFSLIVQNMRFSCRIRVYTLSWYELSWTEEEIIERNITITHKRDVNLTTTAYNEENGVWSRQRALHRTCSQSFFSHSMITKWVERIQFWWLIFYYFFLRFSFYLKTVFLFSFWNHIHLCNKKNICYNHLFLLNWVEIRIRKRYPDTHIQLLFVKCSLAQNCPCASNSLSGSVCNSEGFLW